VPRGRSRSPLARAVPWLLVVAAVAAVTIFVLQGANRPANPGLRTTVGGFFEQAFSIEMVGEPGTGDEHCALLAVTEEQLRTGLMGRRDLGRYVGMVFRLGSDSTRPFTMERTLIPLSIAWFDAQGNYVAEQDMTPCPDGVSCPTYSAGRPYRFALEVPRGRLRALGVGPGSHLTLGAGCR
jgi:uncharacterized membrane protein (UPF0127 family)